MNSLVCTECLENVSLVDDAGRCPACRCRVLLEERFNLGWRAGWSAALAIHGLVEGDSGEVSR